MTRFWQVPNCRELTERYYYQSGINLCFLIFSCLIFQSSVDGGLPSFAAAPFGPATFPLHSASAVSMISLSCFWRVSAKVLGTWCRAGSGLANQAFSIQNVSPLRSIIDLST